MRMEDIVNFFIFLISSFFALCYSQGPYQDPWAIHPSGATCDNVPTCPGLTKTCGFDCKLACNCNPSGTCACHKFTGECICMAGYWGPKCDDIYEFSVNPHWIMVYYGVPFCSMVIIFGSVLLHHLWKKQKLLDDEFLEQMTLLDNMAETPYQEESKLDEYNLESTPIPNDNVHQKQDEIEMFEKEPSIIRSHNKEEESVVKVGAPPPNGSQNSALETFDEEPFHLKPSRTSSRNKLNQSKEELDQYDQLEHEPSRLRSSRNKLISENYPIKDTSSVPLKQHPPNNSRHSYEIEPPSSFVNEGNDKTGDLITLESPAKHPPIKHMKSLDRPPGLHHRRKRSSKEYRLDSKGGARAISSDDLLGDNYQRGFSSELHRDISETSKHISQSNPYISSPSASENKPAPFPRQQQQQREQPSIRAAAINDDTAFYTFPKTNSATASSSSHLKNTSSSIQQQRDKSPLLYGGRSSPRVSSLTRAERRRQEREQQSSEDDSDDDFDTPMRLKPTRRSGRLQSGKEPNNFPNHRTSPTAVPHSTGQLSSSPSTTSPSSHFHKKPPPQSTFGTTTPVNKSNGANQQLVANDMIHNMTSKPPSSLSSSSPPMTTRHIHHSPLTSLPVTSSDIPSDTSTSTTGFQPSSGGKGGHQQQRSSMKRGTSRENLPPGSRVKFNEAASSSTMPYNSDATALTSTGRQQQSNSRTTAAPPRGDNIPQEQQNLPKQQKQQPQPITYNTIPVSSSLTKTPQPPANNQSQFTQQRFSPSPSGNTSTQRHPQHVTVSSPSSTIQQQQQQQQQQAKPLSELTTATVQSSNERRRGRSPVRRDKRAEKDDSDDLPLKLPPSRGRTPPPSGKRAKAIPSHLSNQRESTRISRLSDDVFVSGAGGGGVIQPSSSEKVVTVSGRKSGQHKGAAGVVEESSF